MGERQAIAFGDRVAVVGNGTRWLVVDFEAPHVICARLAPTTRAARGSEVIETGIHPSALVVLEKAR